ncbi:hypothetical protein DM01DRAFT_1335947 [Hesseltinella vesiculosa]|uniref:F-box domain-containing protein n=1 Tax=Hesseltinella vesiculosa TaxID=101127 RepID=A0A1X2GHX7_9FUNG|nr:hypothetical protein DM01DRAFT_1335947 [Hesseltinella vesiculosa]
MSLPLELVPLILQHLAPRHLLNTCLVSHAWAYHSLTRFYDTVYIHTSHQLKSFLKSLQVLPLAYRSAIRAILMNDGAFYCQYGMEITCIAIFASHCPSLEALSCVKPCDTLLSNDPVVTDWAHGYPMSLAIDHILNVDLPYFPRIRRIRLLMQPDSVHQQEPLYRQLTDLALSDEQLDSVVQLFPVPHRPILDLFPALRTLHLDDLDDDYPLDDNALFWLQDHCRSLHHLSMKGITLSGPRLLVKGPVHSSVRSLVLRLVDIESDEWFPLLTTLYPGLQLLSLVDMHFQYREVPRSMLEGLLSWITACRSLASFSIDEHFTTPDWTMEEVLDGLVDHMNSGSWNCQLRHFEMSTSYSHETFPAKRLLECQPLMQQLDTLFLPLVSTDDPSQDELQVELDDCSSGLPALFRLCHLTPGTFANLTTLHLTQDRGHTHVSLIQLLLMCPSLTSLSLACVDLHHEACPRHFPDSPPDTFNLANLTVMHTDVYRSDLFFYLLQHQLPRLASLAFIDTRIHQLSLDPQGSGPFLHLNVALRSLWVIAVNINDHSCSSLCLHEHQSSGRMVRYTSQPTREKEKYKPPTDFHVACLYADHVLFNHSEHFF